MTSDWLIFPVGLATILVQVMAVRRGDPWSITLVKLAAVWYGGAAAAVTVIKGATSMDVSHLLGWIVGLVLFFGVVLGLFFAIVRGTCAILGPRRRLETELGLEVLEERLARGEITREQFEQAKRALGA